MRPLLPVSALLVVWQQSACAQKSPKANAESSVSCAVDTIAGSQYSSCEFLRGSLSFRLVSVDASGRRVASIDRLDGMARLRGERLLFATNAGMYERDSTAVGLLVVEGREERPLNLDPGPSDPCSVANFFCPPNGVFLVKDGQARILTTAEYARLAASSGWTTPQYATQSGPLLVRNGKLARPFNRASMSAKLRSGVCVRADGSVVFALADSVTFWSFAESLRSHYRCRDALFLDGTVSQLYTGAGALHRGGEFSAMFAAFAPADGRSVRPVQAPSAVAITNVAVIDVVTGATRANQNVLISGSRITAVGPTSRVPVPPGARTVNGAGKFLMPGLWDLHTHAVMFGRSSLALFLANGVTGIRDMGAERFAEAKAWRDSIAAGSLLGPRMRIASPIVENPGWLAFAKQVGEQAGTPWTLYERFGPRSAEEATRWVDSVAALGPDHIKVRNWPAPEIARALVARARTHGLRVVAHANEPFPRRGITTLEHSVWPPLGGSRADRDSLWRQLAASGTVFVPTLITWATRLDPPDTLIARLTAGRLPGLEYVPKRTRERWMNQLKELKEEPSSLDWATIYRNELRNVGEMRRAGIELLTGTDVGAPLVVPGFSLHGELANLVNIVVLTPREALAAATIGAAAAVGMADSLGTIESGKLADLVLLDANPLTDITNTRRIRAVIANGRLLDRASIDRMLAEVQARSR